MSQRFYCPDPPRNGRYHLQPEEARHLARVSRYALGDCVELFDGKGFATLARIVELGRDRVDLVAEGAPLPDVSGPCWLTLAIAIPKGERFDWLVEKTTELGVSQLIPLITERAVVDPRNSKLERLKRTIIESSKQSRRNRLMELGPTMTWSELVRRANDQLRLIALPEGLPWGRWPSLGEARRTLLAIGPEGGFSPAEVEMARAVGWHPVRLSAQILRIETAAIAGAAMVLARSQEQEAHARV